MPGRYSNFSEEAWRPTYTYFRVPMGGVEIGVSLPVIVPLDATC
jgi:hypothetical protein